MDDKRFRESSRRKHELYKATLKVNATVSNQKTYVTFCHNFNKTKRAMHTIYYIAKATEFKVKTRKLWQLLSNVINKTKNRGSIIPYIMINGFKTYNPSKIANEFGNFYSNLGKDPASQIPKGNLNIDYYVNKIARNMNSLVMRPTTVSEIDSEIQQLPNKTS